ncbi:hypothetical protein LTR56_017556 [Elasticomyces elasticus]|nr:hypothetical protein LTR56_017556 [Elasticomyces elasticus]KAK3631423.1 hypothetical protein LTR22_021063 [Elasticomyces elasticus]KAK4913894.1 hypothetical protein LTR49_017820 [Elasticomyces elasticus]KAK5766355.1 hypothetical protein LTS12_003567 [Elasticomyces elasticus]
MPPLRIAIVGAGVAGLAAAIALQQHDGIDVQLYERAGELREIGASIALGPNGMRTLERLGVSGALDEDVAFRNKSGYPMIYRHWQTNEIVSVDQHRGEVATRHRTARYYRAHLQQALLAHVEPSRIHLGKAFSKVEFEVDNSGLIIHFADGSTTLTDLLLGADGINSAVRRAFVPTSQPKWTGWVAFRSVFEASRVAHIDADLTNEASHWWAPDRTFFASRLGKDLFAIVGSWQSDPAAADAPFKTATWDAEGDIELLKKFYAQWNPKVRQMIEASPYTRLYPNTAAQSLDTWVYGQGRVSFAGDAAHAHGGAFAAGGSLALDDASAFASAIFHVYPRGSPQKPSRSQLEAALRLYERTRKPHTDRVLAVVHEGNRMKVESLGQTETDEQLRQRMQSRGDTSWLHEHDVEAAFSRALQTPGVGGTQARL